MQDNTTSIEQRLQSYSLIERYLGDYIRRLQARPPEKGKFVRLFSRGDPDRLEDRLRRTHHASAFQIIFREVGDIRNNPDELDRRLMDVWAEIRVLDQLVRERFFDISKLEQPGADFEARYMSQSYVIQATRIGRVPRFSCPATGTTIEKFYKEIAKPIRQHFRRSIQAKNRQFKDTFQPGYIRRIALVTRTEYLQNPLLVYHIACRQIAISVLNLKERHFEEIQWLLDEGNGAIFWVETVNGETKVRCVADWGDDSAVSRHGDCENCYWQEIDLDSEVPMSAWYKSLVNELRKQTTAAEDLADC